MQKYYCKNNFNKNVINKKIILNKDEEIKPRLDSVAYKLSKSIPLSSVLEMKKNYYHKCCEFLNKIDEVNKKQKRRKRFLGLKIASFSFLAVAIGFLTYVSQPKQILLNVDGKDYNLTTNQYFVPLFLNKISSNYQLENDKMQYQSTSGQTLSSGTKLLVRNEKNLILKIAGKDQVYKTYANNLEELLSEFNKKQNLSDESKGLYVSLKHQGKEKETLVKDLDKLDLVLYKTVKTNKEVKEKYKVEYIENSKMETGKEKVKQKGVNGKYLEETTKTYMNNKLTNTNVKRIKTITKKRNEIIEYGTKGYTSNISKTDASYSLSAFMSAGVVNWGGYKFTYYSQSVLPGGGLNIPGRHVSPEGFVVDKDGYIVLASSYPKGTVFGTPFGAKGKVYDRGVSGNHLDVYIR